MNKTKKIKIAVDVALYYFIISTVSYFLGSIYLSFKISRTLFHELDSNASMYAVLVAVILFLAILSNVLKRKVQVGNSIDSKPLFFLIVGVLLIVDGVTNIMTYVSSIMINISTMQLIIKDISLARVIQSMYFYFGVPIIIYALQIGIGAYLTLMTIKRYKQIEKIKVAVDVVLYYFTIYTVVSLSMILLQLLSRRWELIDVLKLNTLRFVVFIVIILFLATLSNVLKRKVREDISIDSKPLLYLIVGVLLIVNGITSIPSQVHLIFLGHMSLTGNIASPEMKTGLINNIYSCVVPVVIYALQIGIGTYFTFMTIKRDKLQRS